MLQRELSSEAERELYFKINRIFVESYRSYGTPRVWRQLLRDGVSCSRRQVSQIMRKHGIISVYVGRKKKFVVTTKSKNTLQPAGNLLERNFSSKAVNQKWVGDVTYVRTSEGWLYLASVMDLFSRKLIGYAMGNRNNADLACKALQMAVTRRQQPKDLIYHSDRGSVYASKDFKNLLALNQITPRHELQR